MSHQDSAKDVPTLDEALAELEGLKEQLSGSDLKVFTQNRELRQETSKLREEVTRLAEECVTQTFTIRTLEKAKAGLEQAKAKLEQSKAELEKNKAELETQVASLLSQVAELEGRVGDLTEEVGVHRSQEIHLSQELERTISANAEEVARLLTEHDSQLTTTRDNLEQAKANLESDLTGRIQAREQEIENLERRVEQFKEEFLSQEVASPISSLSPSVEQGKAFSLLRDRMEGLLGFPGRAMVEQVFRLCGADQTTTDPAVLEEAFEALQDTATKLVRSPEQEHELSALLGVAWQELGLDARSFGTAQIAAQDTPGQATPSAELESPEVESAEGPSPVEAIDSLLSEQTSLELPAEPVEEAPVEEEVAQEETPELAEAVEVAVDAIEESSALEQLFDSSENVLEAEGQPELAESIEEHFPEELVEEQVEASLEAETEPSFEVPLEASVEPSLLDGEAVTEEDMPPVEQPAEESQEVVLDSIDQALAEPSSESLEQIDTESVVEPVAEFGTIPAVEAVEESILESADAEVPAEEAPENAVVANEAEATEAGPVNFDSAADALQNGDYETALSLFRQLREQDASDASYRVGEISALAGLEHYDEAYSLGRNIDPSSLGASEQIFLENFEAILVGRAELAETLVSRKLALIELVDLVRDPDRIQAYLDEVDEIGLRTPSEGRLSLLQAKARVDQDDVTEYLIEAMTSLDDKPEIFDLLRQNLERYPELSPLSDLTQSLLEAPRDEALEAEGPAKSLLVGEETLEDLLNESDPEEEALVQVFLEHLLPRTGLKMELPSEAFEDLLQDSEPAAFVGALRQALRSVDYTLFFDEIEVLSYDGEDHFLLRSSPEPKPTLLFGADVDDVPPEELRFLVLRELFSMHRRHSHLAHLAAQLDDRFRFGFVKACLEVHKEAKFQIPEEFLAELTQLEALAVEGGQDNEFKAKLESALLQIYQATESDSFMELDDFLYGGQLHKKCLDPLADSFAAKQTGLVVASYAIARDTLDAEEFEALEETGFGWLYLDENIEQFRALRLRLQRLWSMPFKALVSEADE